MQIGSQFEFENLYASIVVDTGEVVRFIARNPGTWGNNIEVAIANPEDFGSQKQVFEGIDLDGLYEYFPDADNNEIGIVIKEGAEIKEVYLVSLDKDSRDSNNKSNFIESVLNRQSNLVHVKYVGDAEDGIASCLALDAVKLDGGTYEEVTEAALLTAYEVWSNKEEVDIDIVIGNELDDGNSAFALANDRKDCIAFLGTQYNIVGLKAAQANTAVLDNRGDRNSMFASYAGNYKYQYDRYNDKNRWVNLAGDMAGLRAATSSSRASWWASAGQILGSVA